VAHEQASRRSFLQVTAAAAGTLALHSASAVIENGDFEAARGKAKGRAKLSLIATSAAGPARHAATNGNGKAAKPEATDEERAQASLLEVEA
jgi:hypothetical protein